MRVFLYLYDIFSSLRPWSLVLVPYFHSVLGLVPDSLSHTSVESVRVRPIPERQLSQQDEEGRQLRVVLNTNDPDYEHIYSIESYSDLQEEDADLTPTSILANDEANTAEPLEASRRKRESPGAALAQPCSLPLDEGSCSNYTLRWYFNTQAGTCRPFVYSGCGGNENHFLAPEDCELQCLGGSKGAVSPRKGR
ncbi:tissue factor pathway inhibitor 2 isoform X1 [Brienomyrus brachyistius]|uniref:tissue factor pathway inhibitor 2 isoform X1 n=1 Tax=Brienomyrus brachyistius TaxID=42636 RepID=UPI0020B3BB29|nr:tissue factor pathway inhibitor 2 isoform X1 [Brienomyrus brachyistius]